VVESGATIDRRKPETMISKSCSAHLAEVITLGMLALGVTLGARSALAEDCLAKSTRMEDIIEAIKTSSGCDAAMKLFEACEYGASGDVQFGSAVEEKCQADFFDRLNTAQNKTYQLKLLACDRKYRSKSGTMYVSFTAFCRAEVAQNYARKQRK
jgi:hypothetical protein